MNSPATTSAKKEQAKIVITDDKVESDGSVTVQYALNEQALKACGVELNKNFKELTEQEIHSFVMKNIGSALKGHNGWTVKEIN